MNDHADHSRNDTPSGGERDASRHGSRLATAARWVLPFVVSAAFLAWVLSGVDAGAVMAELTPAVARIFVPALIVFLAITLLIEAVCLVLVVSHTRPFSDLVVAARIKAASYLLGILNYALGAGALTVLLRRRAGMPLSEAAGAVLVIGLFDLGSLIAMAITGLALLGSEGTAVRVGVVALAGAAIVAGFAVLRAPVAMGPFDRVRELRLFHAARTLPVGLLARLAALRFGFVACFVGMAWATLGAFEVQVPALPLVVNTSLLLLVAALPIAAAGLGTGQAVFIALFRRWAPDETLLAASLLLSFALIVTRSAMGLFFAGEFAREAMAHREEAGS